ncbi:uncharacterized protein LOC142150781 [Mixophyes fleayi]|uniref:uncharacterized protein LOC142150781 n=1 Tax=Mixophyes fleayi TaxID=3061075 RepID=UPI003F4DED98
MAQERRSTRRTGGGPPLRMEYTTYEEELRQIMPAEIVEGINVQDTDSPSFGQVVESPGPQFSPSARPTPPPSARDSGTDEQAGPSSYQPPQAESLEMSPEPEDLTTITLVTVDAPVSGLQEVSPGPAEPSHQQPAPAPMDPAREMALSIGAFQQQQTLFMDRSTLDQMKLTRNTLEQMELTRSTFEQMELTRNTLEQMELTKNTMEQMELTRNTLKHMELNRNTLEHMELTRNPLEQMDLNRSTMEQMELTRNTLEQNEVTRNTLVETEDTRSKTS